MTINNYTKEQEDIFIEQILKIINSNKHNYQFILRDIYPELYQFIQYKNPILQNHSFPTKVYWVIHHLSDFPKCENPTCTNKITTNIKSLKVGHRKHCCSSCAQKNPITRELLFKTKLKNYGDGNYNNREKANRTCEQKYGSTSYSATIEYRIKTQKTKEQKYGDKNYNNRDKAKQTTLKLYHIDNYAKLEECKQKIQSTCLKVYNQTHYNKSEDGKKKIISSVQKKYGVDNVSQIPEIREKCKQTCMKHFNVENYTQSYEYHKNKIHKYHSEKYPGLTFDSTWEVKVYEFCKDNEIEVEYSPSISYEYEYDNRTWTYHPDFLINGKVYEVKGEQFFRINESTNKEEMYCPYRNPDWSDEHYSWMCGKYEAKHQCMLKNEVIILREIELNNLRSVLFIKE